MNKIADSAFVSDSGVDHVFVFISAWALSLGYLPLLGIGFMAIFGR